MVLLIDRIIDLLNLIIEKKLAASIVLELFGLSLPYMLALSIPWLVLVATILAFGRMTVDRETIAIKSSGGKRLFHDQAAHRGGHPAHTD
jgi:lipopolysaccharide export system permease protein